MSNVRNFLNTITVHETDLTKIRVGNENDGGYVVLKEIAEITPTVYTFGVGDDVGFELDWVERFPKSRVKLCDPYIDRLPKEHSRFSFHRYGIGSKYKPPTKVEPNSLLKVDVEGDEWSAFQVMDESVIKSFSQIVMEIHCWHVEAPAGLSPYFWQFYRDIAERVNEDLFASYYDTMKFLANWFLIVHIHANNSLPTIFLEGYRFPPLLELTLVRRDLVKNGRLTAGPFPVPGLDYPNKTNRPDVFDYYPMADVLKENKIKREDLINGTQRKK